MEKIDLWQKSSIGDRNPAPVNSRKKSRNWGTAMREVTAPNWQANITAAKKSRTDFAMRMEWSPVRTACGSPFVVRLLSL